LVGCPAKDWIKREDTYLSVEQYRTMTEVININDNLYRVKKGEEINQNEITQLFENLHDFINANRAEQKNQFRTTQERYKSGTRFFNTMLYVLILLETKGKEEEAHKILSELDYSTINLENKNLINLAQILHTLIKSSESLENQNMKLKNRIGQLKKEYELVQEEVIYLNKQVNALKFIEENIHAREVGIELESR